MVTGSGPMFPDGYPDGRPDESLRGDELQSVFGMREMEAAAAVIVAHALRARTWRVAASIDDFRTDCSRTGFCQLLARGWLVVDPAYNGWFVPTAGFVERVANR